MHTDPGVVLVSGGASGLGAAVVRAIADAGGTPLVVDLRQPAGEIAYEVADVTRPREAEAAVRTLSERHGGLDGVVTTAGIDVPGPLGAVDPDAWERVIAVNLIGTAAIVRAALPDLERRAGRVVTISSTLGFRAAGDATAYCASKFGVVGFTRALAAELAGRVGVTLVTPGGMRTPFFDGREEQYRPGPDALLNDPADVARGVLFALCQPAGCELRELVLCPAQEGSWPP
jgi:NAD(P)-dependent dehydrogenase (short-subunit alcohol dehydrogenase family)